MVAGIGVIAAIILYAASKRFRVDEDPRIDEIEALLPGANCGGCGQRGCRDFALACTRATTLEGLNCPVSPPGVMQKIAAIVGLVAVQKQPDMAIVRCNGTCANRQRLVKYEGVSSCAIEASLFAGETACAYGCLGCGDCVSVCPYGAMTMDTETRLPHIDYDKCVGCGKCVKACPRNIVALVPRHENRAQVWVSCVNHDKGAVAIKECKVSCIGCGKCMKVCPSEAINVKSFVASIDPDKCISCGACVEVCPRNSIRYFNLLQTTAREEDNI